MRKIKALDFPDVPRAEITTRPPELRVVDPTTLYVDETYQRGLSERSIRLIRKIVSEWDWRAFKPPVVVEIGDGKLEVIDGQHTAIGAVTHGGIVTVPVLVIEAPERANRAGAFVRHNRDRIQVTSQQLHSALVAAGDEDALTVDQVCARSGSRVLKSPPGNGVYQVGDTLAVTTLKAVINRRHAAGARRVLVVCVKGGAAPISATLMKGVECLLYTPEYKGQFEDEQLALLVSALGNSLQAEAERFAAEHHVTVWRALASVLYMNRRKARNAA